MNAVAVPPEAGWQGPASMPHLPHHVRPALPQACLCLVEKRETRYRVQWYYRLFEETQRGLTRSSSMESVHGSLLALGELMNHTGRPSALHWFNLPCGRDRRGGGLPSMRLDRATWNVWHSQARRLIELLLCRGVHACTLPGGGRDSTQGAKLPLPLPSHLCASDHP